MRGFLGLLKRVEGLEARVQANPPRKMVRYKGAMFAKVATHRPHDQRGEACCPWCSAEGRDLRCDEHWGQATDEGSEPEVDLTCKHPSHGHPGFHVRMRTRDYMWAIQNLPEGD